MKYIKGEKVYILKKSCGDSIMNISLYMDNEDIIYRGVNLNVLVGYYNYKRYNRHVISRSSSVYSGDYYLDGDFINEEELGNSNNIIILPDEIWNLDL